MNRILRYTLGLRLDDVIHDLDFEKQVFDNLRRCKRLIKKEFQVLFYHDDLTKQEIESFVIRNKDILFELGSEITSDYRKCWFLVTDENRQGARYRFQGGILPGIVQYLNLVKQLQRVERG